MSSNNSMQLSRKKVLKAYHSSKSKYNRMYDLLLAKCSHRQLQKIDKIRKKEQLSGIHELRDREITRITKDVKLIAMFLELRNAYNDFINLERALKTRVS